MSIDRLHELRVSNPSGEALLLNAAERGQLVHDPLTQFLTEASQLRDRISTLHEELNQLERSKRLATTDPSSKLIAQLSQKTRNLQQEFGKVKTSYDELARFPFAPGALNPSQQRIRGNKLTNLAKALESAIVIFSDIQRSFHQHQQQRQKRTIQTIRGQGEGDDGPKIADSSLESFSHQHQIYDASMNQNAALVLQDYQLRHEDILALERGMEELHSMFLDLSQMVAQQGEIIDQIDENTEATTQYTEKGVVQIVGATKKAKFKRYVIWILISILLVIIIVALCYVINTFSCRR